MVGAPQTVSLGSGKTNVAFMQCGPTQQVPGGAEHKQCGPAQHVPGGAEHSSVAQHNMSQEVQNIAVWPNTTGPRGVQNIAVWPNTKGPRGA